MSDLAWTSMAAGSLILLIRTPLLVAPDATMGIYRALLETDVRIRLLGACTAPIGLALILGAHGSGGLTGGAVSGLGWLMLGAALSGMMLMPRRYRIVAEVMMDSFYDVRRPLGAVAVGIGMLLIVLGMSGLR